MASTTTMITSVSKPALMSINDTKAGMEGLDKEKIDSIIHEASKDSAFFKHQQQRQKRLDRQIEHMLAEKAAFKPDEIESATKAMDEKVRELQAAQKDLAHLIGHLDMDMFFAAVEIRDDPSLADKPIAVGSNSMIATSNYVARKFGVRAGMAGFIGLKLCPELKIIKPNFRKYSEASKKVMAVIAEYDPNYYPASLDEAYFDLTNFCVHKFSQDCPNESVYTSTDDGYVMFTPKVWATAEATLNEIRSKIKEATKLTCSGAIAHNTRFSKVCSDLNKPDGQFILAATSPQAVDEFINKVEVRKIPGIGPVSQQQLKALGIETCRQLYEERGIIYLLFQPASVDFYLRVSLGISSTSVEPSDRRDRKSLGAETTFKATRDVETLTKCLEDLSHEVSDELKEKKLTGRVITLRIKWDSFKSIVRNRTISRVTHDFELIFKTVKELLQHELATETQMKIRLLGVRISGFAEDTNGDANTGHGWDAGAGKGALLPFFGKSIKDSIVWTITYDTGEIETNANPTDMSIYEKQDPISFAYVCLTCNSLFKTEQELSDHISKTSHSGPVDDVITIPDASITCPICSATFDSVNQVEQHIDSAHQDQ